MNCFRADGHLTDESLRLLAENVELDPLARLEIAEHLAFCDLCLQRYTEALEAAPLLAPARSCRESLWARVRMRTLRLLTSRYATAAAAVALALTLVWGGRQAPFPEAPAEPDGGPAPWSEALDGAMEKFGSLFDRLELRGGEQGGINE